MGKKTCWTIIFITMAINVVMLHSTIEAYYGKEYNHVYLFTGIALVSVLCAVTAAIRWKNLEYSEEK